MGRGAAKRETAMKSGRMGMLLLLSVGMAQAAPPEMEHPCQAPALRAREAAPPRGVHPQTSSARKAEVTRRMFWLALSLR